MGQKTSPIAFRLGINKECDSVWYVSNNYAELLLNDEDIRKLISKRYEKAGIAKVLIKRKTTSMEVTIKVARPGIIIGKGGEEADSLKKKLQIISELKDVQVYIVEEKKVDMSAPILGQNIARQLEKRIAFRRAMKQSVGRAMRAGAKGIKIACAGRLGGAEIARTEWYKEGKIPLQTIRADIDYSFTEANTIYGKIGVKVWIYKGEIL